jgi:transposase
MTTKTRRAFTDEFKAETVALLETSGRPLTQIAAELGIEPSVLRSWRRKLQPASAPAMAPVGAAVGTIATSVPTADWRATSRPPSRTRSGSRI